MEATEHFTTDKKLPLNSSNVDVISICDTESDSDESSSSLEIIENPNHIDVIELDDTVEDSFNGNNSVISIQSESTGVDLETTIVHFELDTAPDFIPVKNCHVAKLKRKRLRRKSKNVIPKVQTNIPKIHQTRIIQLSYPNILNDKAKESQMVGLRPIIIDGCNVGFGYGNGNFAMRGIILVIQYFKNRGHDEIVCFLPQRYRHRIRSPSEERTVDSLEKENMFSFTPSRRMENGIRYTPYDDRYILQYATERQGVIISNDGYRDLINEELSWRETIEKRIVNYTFARGIFMLPKDPLGPSGPTLDEMLKFPEN